jgi:RNase P subunit RPR2
MHGSSFVLVPREPLLTDALRYNFDIGRAVYCSYCRLVQLTELYRYTERHGVVVSIRCNVVGDYRRYHVRRLSWQISP